MAVLNSIENPGTNHVHKASMCMDPTHYLLWPVFFNKRRII